MFGVRIRIFVAVLALMSSATSATAVSAPAASGLAINPVVWKSNSSPLTLGASLSAAGNWKVEIISRCTGLVMRTATGSVTRAERITASFDKTSEPVLTDGPYEVRLTPSTAGNVAGTSISTDLAVQPESVSTTRIDSVCANAQRLVATETLSSILAAQVLASRDAYPDSTTVLLAGYDKSHIATTAVMAVYARMRGLPLLFTSPTALNKVVARELARRHATKVVLLGTVKDLSATVEKTLKTSNYSLKRIQAPTLTDFAIRLFTPTFVPAKTPAVFVNFSGSEQSILEAASFASATNRPLFPLSSTVLSQVTKALATLKTDGGIAIGSKSDISDSAIAKIGKVTRIYSSNVVQQSLVLARSISNPVDTALSYAPKAHVDVLTIASLMKPAMPLAVGASGLSLDQRRFLNARGDVTKVVTPNKPSEFSDASLANVAAVIAQRGATVIPILEQPALEDFTAPATFAFSGSGFGHGIGLSQWGAYAMAKSGMSAEDILTHYFPETTVGETTDTVEMHVGLQTRISKLVMKAKSVGDGDAEWKLAASSGEKVTLTASNVVTFKYDAAKDLVKTTISGPGSLTLPAAASVTVLWSGTRYSAKNALSDAAAAVQVIGPSETSATGRWYRFGYMRIGGIGSAKASDGTTKAAGLTVANSVRLHDEYLYGLGEVSSSWPAEALRAQVIAARGYAYNRAYTSTGTARKRSAECDCTIDDGASAQVFVGWSKLAEAAGPRWKAAVDASLTSETTGQVVKYGSLVVQTFFSSASGGRTQNHQDVWGGTPKPYWQGVDDPWSVSDVVDQRIAAWQPRIRPQAFMAEIFGLSSVYYLDLSNRLESGALKSVTAYGVSKLGSNVQVTMSASNFRLSMGKDINPGDGVDPYDALPSEWVWRLRLAMTGEDLVEKSTNLVSQRSLGYASTAASKSKVAVLITAPSGDNDPKLFLAAAFAGSRRAALYVVKAAGDATRIKNELTSRGITSAIAVGAIDSAITNALVSASIPTRTITGSSASDLAIKLANEATSPTGVVLASESEPSAWPLAVTVAARAGLPLLLVKDGALTPDAAQWLTTAAPANITLVGSAAELPDVVVAGFAKASRINTSDLPLAALATLNFGSSTVRAIVATSATAATNDTVIAASLGLPLFYSDSDTQQSVIDWLHHKSLITAIVNVGADEAFVNALSYA